MKKFEDVMTSTFGDGWEKFAPMSLSVEDKAEIKRALFSRFEQNNGSFVDLLALLNVVNVYPER